MLMSGNGATVNTIRLHLLWTNISEVVNTLCTFRRTIWKLFLVKMYHPCDLSCNSTTNLG